MRLRVPLDSVLDRPVKVKILRVLISPGLELTGREVAAEARIDPAGCARALRELVEIGLLEMQPTGRAHLYKLTQDNLLVSAGLGPLFKAERLLLEAAFQFLQERFEHRVVSAVLFGSYARGEETHDSDVDVLFLVREKSEAEQLETDVLLTASEFSRYFGATVAPYVKPVSEFLEMAKRNAPPINEILATGKDLFGTSLREVLASGSHQVRGA